MRSIVAIAALTALTVAVAAPATAGAAANRAPLGPQVEMGPTLHPSGKDRLVEHGGSGTQGWAQHDPDGDYNYGVDQNGDLGGLYTGDQDGNNGCGNDQDFEDDNNGNCGGGRTTDCDALAPGSDTAAQHRNARSLPQVDDSCEPECEVSCSDDEDSSWSLSLDAFIDFDLSMLL